MMGCNYTGCCSRHLTYSEECFIGSVTLILPKISASNLTDYENSCEMLDRMRTVVPVLFTKYILK